MISRYFRYPDGVFPNVMALGVTLAGYPLGVALLVQSAWFFKATGFALVTVSLIWSAYFIHEFAHQTIFRSAIANARWGALMAWINGSCYAKFDDLRRTHMRHHVERADIITFDVQCFLKSSPAPFRKTVLALEWAYFPAVEFLMRGFMMAKPFTDRGSGRSRLRVVAIFLVRATAFALLGWLSLSALLLYTFAYLLFVTALRFADCFQHTYDAYPIPDGGLIRADKVRDRDYEQTNTYSDIVGIDHPWLNLLWLNFGYHNAHHERPAMPWHQLPAYHREAFGEDHPQVMPVGELLRSFHVNRVRRILATDYGQVRPAGTPRRADAFLGAVGVSFLTAA